VFSDEQKNEKYFNQFLDYNLDFNNPFNQNDSENIRFFNENYKTESD